jgi:Ca-activated chloride channel family protein
MLTSEGSTLASSVLDVNYLPYLPTLPVEVLDAAARASVARLQRRAQEAVRAGLTQEAIRLSRVAAMRLEELGEAALASIARDQATALERDGRASSRATKELTYATRRLGEL